MSIELFLKLKGAEGEATTKGFEGQIQLEGFHWAFAAPPSGVGEGLSAGKVEHSGFSAIKKLDKSSPKLFQAICEGKHFDNAVLTACKRGGGEKVIDYWKCEFDSLFITAFDQAGNSGGDEIPRENCTFTFGKVTITYNEQKKDGTKGAATVATHDFKKG